jgi:hypothetical protein
MITPESVRLLVQSAVLAPSSHNTQPWRFRVSAATIEVLADRTRALPVNDPFDRELVISCGAAVLSLRAAIAAAGWGARVQLLPAGAGEDVLARVEIGNNPPDTELAALAPFLEQRRTYRKAFKPQTVAGDAVAAIAAAASVEGATLLTLDADQRELAASLVAEGDRIQWHDPRWRRELAMWMHPRRDGDGLSVPTLAVPLAQAVVRTFDMGQGVAAKDRDLLLGSPWLTLLATPTDEPVDWLRAGQALQRALLVGCRQGLQASYLNQPVEVAPLRERLQSGLGITSSPQLLLRWGYPGDDVPPAPRRPVDAVIEPAA